MPNTFSLTAASVTNRDRNKAMNLAKTKTLMEQRRASSGHTVVGQLGNAAVYNTGFKRMASVPNHAATSAAVASPYPYLLPGVG